MRLDVREVVAASRLEVDVIDRVGQLGGRVDVLPASSRRSVDASIHPASSRAPARSRAGAVSPAASSAARIRWAPRLSPRTTHAHPNPLTMSTARNGSCAALQAKSGVDVGALGSGEREVLGLATAPHPLRGRCGCVGEPRGVRGEGSLGHPGLGHRFERERADAVEEPVSDGRDGSSSSTITSERPAAGRRHRSRRLPERRAPRGRTRPPRGARHRRTWRAPRDLADRRGTTGRSSIRSST